ncbi:NAD(P)-binding protein [Aspergillus uvarum CBS 121591]|uniref:NAD(P)-binding protein n=1 Tax=Aspergillus uvarum CBS 121591 TaxID=1448315 RepID=A0A319CJD9_9EURO|nr:NAD(P)-binding protein [Aspergillus uvarum CBS 121591]PYH78793.1 NAD(P)-binding protein [Aspergillus uvarum CBS 121591]
MVQYLLTGVTGGLGAHVLEYFLAHVDPSTYAVASSNPAKASKFTAKGLAFRAVNYDDPSTLATAFEEVENLFFVSSNTFDNERRRRQHQDVVDAAKRAGVKHVRTRLYTEAFPLYFNWYPTTQTIVLPQPTPSTTPSETPANTQRITFTSREELGHATARLLLRGGGNFRNQIVVLSARETLSFRQIVDLINQHHHDGKEGVRIEFVPPAEYVARNAAADEGGKPAGFFEAMVSWHEGIAKGEAVVDGDGLMAEVLGREPTRASERIRELLSEARAEGGYTWHQNYA